MRHSLRVLALAAILLVPLGGTATAAPPVTQDITVTGSAMYMSLLGGMTNGNAALSGTISNGEIGTLRGTVNFPLQDLALSVTPEVPIAFRVTQVPLYWWTWTCDQYGCTQNSGVSTFEQRFAQGPVTLRAGALHGSGNLSLSTTAVCVANCPPPGASYSPPYGYSSLNGALTSANEAGTLSINGGPAVIH